MHALMPAQHALEFDIASFCRRSSTSSGSDFQSGRSNVFRGGEIAPCKHINILLSSTQMMVSFEDSRAETTSLFVAQ
jgi:hypothetical protein